MMGNWNFQVDRISGYSAMGGGDLVNRIVSLEKENEGLKKCEFRSFVFALCLTSGFHTVVEKMQKSQDTLEKRLNDLEKKSSGLGGAAPAKQQAPAKPAPAKKDEDDDVDLFGSSDVSQV